MKKTVITDDLIVFSDGFVWKRLSRKVAEALWNSVISHELELYWVRTDDESEAAIEGFDAYNPQTEVYSGFGSTEVESRAMLLIDLLDKKVLTLSDLNLKSLNRI